MHSNTISVRVRTPFFVHLFHTICVNHQGISQILQAFKRSYLYVISEANYLHKNTKHSKDYRIKLMFTLTRSFKDHSVSLTLVAFTSILCLIDVLRELKLLISPKKEINHDIILDILNGHTDTLIYLDNKVCRYLFIKSNIEFTKAGNIKYLALFCHCLIRLISELMVSLHSFTINRMNIYYQYVMSNIHICLPFIEDSISSHLVRLAFPVENSFISKWKLRYFLSYIVICLNNDG